jgi:hypothetical protein
MNKKHGQKNTREYISWLNMRQRCLNNNHPDYSRYGGRGIKFCEHWNDFIVFFTDMGKRPAGTSLERKDNNKGYNKQNCVWATQTQQCRNRKTSSRVSAFGKTQTIAAWAEETGLLQTSISWRLRHGWTTEKALTQPAGKQSNRTETKQ